MGEGSRQYLPDILRLDKEYIPTVWDRRKIYNSFYGGKNNG